MFQTFENASSSSTSKQRVSLLRTQMRKENIDWYLVPHADEHQNEYLPTCAERLSWITSFTGSAGFSIIGLENAYIFVDGRYTTQVKQQTDISLFTQQDLVEDRPSNFIKSIASAEQTIGYDPNLITIGQVTAWQKSATFIKADLKPLDNLIDRIWDDQPAPPLGKLFLHPENYSGESAISKLVRLRQIVSQDDCDYLLLSDPASIAWAFNIRGNDVVHNPIALGHAIVPSTSNEQPLLFIDKRKINKAVKSELSKIAKLIEPSQFEKKLGLAARKAKIHCDPNLVASSLGDIIKKRKGVIVKKRDPVVALRAIKNKVELDGARNAHIRDGVACVKFLSWLDNQKPNTIDEIKAAKQLEEIRLKNAKAHNSELMEVSFDTISGAGSNGAIVHYRVNEDSNAALQDGSLYLVDSGAQYLDGTTDITRTIAIGTPPDGAIEDFTLVLKGHIAIALARFPEGTRGVDLDILARKALWRHGKDYAHGTGHGVGSFLNVHEGPQSISKRGMEPIKAGMLTSNEPGFYKEGEYGIRIENLIIAKSREEISDEINMMGFETITLCPIDSRLIDPMLLDDVELHWLNAYHGWVKRTLVEFLENAEQQWLIEATKPISKELPAASA